MLFYISQHNLKDKLLQNKLKFLISFLFTSECYGKAKILKVYMYLFKETYFFKVLINIKYFKMSIFVLLWQCSGITLPLGGGCGDRKKVWMLNTG